MLNESKRVYVDINTSFQRVTIADLPKYGKCLFLDGDLQSAELDQVIYHSTLVEPAFRYNPQIETVLILGGGEGATAKRVLDHDQVKKVTMVDIDKQLVAICEQYLPEWHCGAFSDQRLSIVYQDAAEFIKTPSQLYDLVVWDLTDPYRWDNNVSTPSTGLYASKAFDLLKTHLVDNGLLSIEYGYRHRNLVAPLLQGLKKLSRRDLFLPSFEEKWIFALLRKEVLL